MNKYAIIVAGGSGKRMQSHIPKQFLHLGRWPILMHTIMAFEPHVHKIVVVLPEKEIPNWMSQCEEEDFTVPHSIVAGGQHRFDSVKNGLQAIENDGLVAIHDGVRPLVSNETILRCFEAAAAHGAALPVIDVNESLRKVKKKDNEAVDRSKYRLVQTPQVFSLKLLNKAFTQSYKPQFTDDASVVEATGHKIFLVEGNRENIKITTPLDMLLAEAIVQKHGFPYLTKDASSQLSDAS